MRFKEEINMDEYMNNEIQKLGNNLKKIMNIDTDDI